MATSIRKPVVTLPKTAPSAAPVASGGGFRILDMLAYGGAFVLPESDYIWKQARTQLFTPTNKQGQAQGAARLGVVVVFMERNNPANEHDQFYSLGQQIHQSFMPSDDGTTIVPVPNGLAATPPDSTNFALLLNSLLQCGLAERLAARGIDVAEVSDNLAVLDGIHVHMIQVPEPEGRKAFQSKTGEAAQEQAERGPRKIAVCGEIFEEFGIPEVGAATPAPVPVAPKPALAKPGIALPKITPKVVVPPPPPPPAAEESGDVDAEVITQEAILNAFTAQPGLTKINLRMGVFKEITEKYGADMGNAIIGGYFSDDATLTGLLNGLNLTLKAGKVVSAT